MRHHRTQAKVRVVSRTRAISAFVLLLLAGGLPPSWSLPGRAAEATTIANTSPGRDWQATLDNPATPGSFPPPRAFTAAYRVRWGDVEAARAEATFTPSNSGELQTRVTTQTVGMARSLWTMDSSHLELTRRSDLLPLWLQQTETISSKQNAFRVDFEPGFAERRHREGKPGETLTFAALTEPAAANDRSKRFEYPGLRDIVSAFLYLRSQPLADGEQHTVSLMSAKNPYLATTRVVGRGEVQVKAGRYRAIELELTLQKIDKEGRLKHYKQFKNARVWLSDDADRLLLKTDTRVFVGHMVLELDAITFPSIPAATN